MISNSATWGKACHVIQSFSMQVFIISIASYITMHTIHYFGRTMDPKSFRAVVEQTKQPSLSRKFHLNICSLLFISLSFLVITVIEWRNVIYPEVNLIKVTIYNIDSIVHKASIKVASMNNMNFFDFGHSDIRKETARICTLSIATSSVHTHLLRNAYIKHDKEANHQIRKVQDFR